MAGFYIKRKNAYATDETFDFIVDNIDQVSSYSQDDNFRFMAHYYGSEPDCFLHSKINEGNTSMTPPRKLEYSNYEGILYIYGEVVNRTWEEY